MSLVGGYNTSMPTYSDAFFSGYYHTPASPDWSPWPSHPPCASSPDTPTSLVSMSPDEMGNYGGLPRWEGVDSSQMFGHIQGPRVVKRRTSANKKERRRTQSINNAFAELRECIPNVPADTKLSKIKTLRLATSYIAYLMDVLNSEETQSLADTGRASFKVEVPKNVDKEEEKRKKDMEEVLGCGTTIVDKKGKGRTGWPQHVWASELTDTMPTLPPCMSPNQHHP